ncbi:hypothetical protein OYT1_ch1264 [Ferriphaselus amnicola]|uniref:Uncharacterized protein n=1 Tax=Ferriphaselus amnicola TaxID=1188319 RepID=A0A2Z6GB54_9PROT|nr:hypothetical protein [Ferriphaselus amnicola]BBE50821.1 hypothetical protein OYT1_ch1264 [Ferriphaselus amnicola]
MTRHIRFTENFHAVDGAGNSSIKYRAGETYPATEETERLTASGIAVAVEIADEPTPAIDAIDAPATDPASADTPVS